MGDLEAVVDAAGSSASRCSGCRRAAPVAIAYAVRHPERVSELVLYGDYARGRLQRDTSPARASRPSS